MRKWLAILVAVLPTLLVAGYVYAASCSLKVWSTGNTVQTSDLNGNFSCLNAASRGTAGASLITDADVSGSASINYQKLSVPQNIIKSWAQVALCNAPGACTVNASNHVTGATRGAGVGVYTVSLSYTAGFPAAVVQANAPAITTVCNTTTAIGTTVTVSCSTTTTGAAIDSAFSLIVMDVSNVY